MAQHRYKAPVNYRATATLIAAEPISVVGGTALIAEAPADPADAQTPVTVTVGGSARTRVTGAPSAGQYRFKTQVILDAGVERIEYLPVLELHSSDEGLAGTVTYYGTGTILTAEWWAAMRAFIAPVVGVADFASLPAPSSDYYQRGFPGDIAILTNGTICFSSGTVWTQVASGAPMPVVGALVMARAFGLVSDASWTPPGVWTADENITGVLGILSDATFAAAGSWAAALDIASSWGVASDAIQAEVAALALAGSLGVSSDGTWAAGGGGGSSALSNMDFESALAAENQTSAPSNPSGNWTGWVTAVDGASALAQRSATHKIDGTYGGYLEAAGFTDDDTIFEVGTARLVQRIARSDLDSAGAILSFKVKGRTSYLSTSPSVFLRVTVYTSGNADISKTTGGANTAKLWGASTGSEADQSWVFAPSATAATVTGNLKNWLSNAVAIGNHWSDIDHVDLEIVAQSTMTIPTAAVVDTFAIAAAPTAPYIVGFADTQFTQNATNTTLNLPTSQAGDLLLAVATGSGVLMFSSTSMTLGRFNGWTHLYYGSVDTYWAWAKISSGSETAPFTIPSSGTSGAIRVYAIRGASSTLSNHKVYAQAYLSPATLGATTAAGSLVLVQFDTQADITAWASPQWFHEDADATLGSTRLRTLTKYVASAAAPGSIAFTVGAGGKNISAFEIAAA